MILELIVLAGRIIFFIVENPAADTKIANMRLGILKSIASLFLMVLLYKISSKIT